MQKTLKKFIKQNESGLFLLDPPTGFGKTTVVLELIRSFLRQDSDFSHIKKIFFVTNLKTNLPFEKLLEGLEKEQKDFCFLAKATDEYVIDRLLDIKITIPEIANSREYKNLRNEVEAIQSLYDNFNTETNEDKKKNFAKNIKILKSKIAGETEPAFRRLIKTRYFYNKSIQEKKNFIKKHEWFKHIYPICNMEKYKVVFLTTKRFILPIDTFQRLPFNIYNDDIAKNAMFFIDEFDATKQDVLDQIVDDGLKHEIDIVKLFLDIHFALQNLIVPKKLSNTSSFHKEKEVSDENGKHWYTTQEHFDYWREAFENIFNSCYFKYLIRSVGFEYDKAFLFDDGNYFNVIKDSTKKYICANVDKKEDFLALTGQDYIMPNQMQINTMLEKIERCIDGFARAVFYIANNFRYYKNEGKKDYQIEYTQEEALFSILDVLNLNEEEKQYLFAKIRDCDYWFNKPDEDPTMRRGFNFTEIEDSNYHDIKSIIHSYKFHITPEDIIIKLAEKALVVGISATARVKTCIGNYDINYLTKKLGSHFVAIDKEDQDRIADAFYAMQEETRQKYAIHAELVDKIPGFSDKEKCQYLIDKLFCDEYKDKYMQHLENAAIKTYYFLIELKLAWIYSDMKEKGYKSFIGFLNGFPKSNSDFNKDRLFELFSDVDSTKGGDPIRVEIVEADNYDYKFQSIYKDLAQGKPVYVLTTYQTIGSGKNIQYKIPETERDKIVFCSNDTRGEKDFDAIYVSTPTNLLQMLSYDSENKYCDLAKFLFHQEYLYQNKLLYYYEMKHNIANGFRRTFFQDQSSFYIKNGDLYANTLRLIIQAVGRICRCRNKNKNIYLYADTEVIERIQFACSKEQPQLLNEEFKALLLMQLENNATEKVEDYSRQSKRAYWSIRDAAYRVRYSKSNVKEWQQLREYVLQNPTANTVLEKYSGYYFEFSDQYRGYSYKYGEKFSIVDIKMDVRYQDMEQVSEQACDLPIILGSKNYLVELFKLRKYATSFKKGKYIMSPSLFRQVYLGALGEVVGREILQREIGYDLQELDDISMYEFFDFKYKNIYFDFKHWDKFRTEADAYSAKIKRKLSKINGAKCFVVNLIKRTDAEPMKSVDGTIIQIPYLIDGANGTINEEGIEYIEKLMETT